jgi:hypothetical protein
MTRIDAKGQRTEVRFDGPRIACSMDGGPRIGVKDVLVIDRRRPHSINCVAAEMGNAVAATPMLFPRDAPPKPAPDKVGAAPVAATTSPFRPLFAAAAGVAALAGGGGVGARTAVDVGVVWPAWGGELFVGGRFGFEYHGNPATVSVTQGPGATPASPLPAQVTHADYLVSVPFGYRLGPSSALLAPYAVVAPEVSFEDSTARGLPTGDETGSTASLGVTGYGGLELRVGVGQVFLEGGYRAAVPVNPRRFFVPLDGAVVALGFRFTGSPEAE